ncbi:ADP compounds hydrolase NudE [Thalassotalea sediminis]|uniref:ADP compounds hydrolase NudE n=1 Tax=Thalassotalea sediminis TaxID=1759089 RepID=UPI0025734684|nr:ADP compounds hydrolase NudE [Thalassotalea sediminis]
MSNNKQLPKINKRTSIAKSMLFSIEQLALTFSNGAERVYERMEGSGRGAVMIVPMTTDDQLILVKEYCAGTHSYELGFPKGLIDPGEKAIEAANRELKEEVGFGANELNALHKVAMAPAFFAGDMEIFTARDLYPEKLPGDEPEPMELVYWPIQNYAQLLSRSDFNEARSIAALMLVVDQLRTRK